ncbi:MAG: membrane protein insertion efficiency factor YidD [SAR324 cluster bacterium]|nr:membrane protein insertion efficiency factor YidD [SAR324 cluster bacterium]
MKTQISKLLSYPLLGLIWVYRNAISPLLPPSCNYQPTCSEYTAQSIEKHGPFWGALLGLRRIFSCHPFKHGGYDPVPETIGWLKLWKKNG